MIYEHVTTEFPYNGKWDHQKLVWMIMEVENTMILRERVRKEYDYKSVPLFIVLTYFMLDI